MEAATHQRGSSAPKQQTLSAETLARIDAIPNRAIRAYETELAYQKLAIEQAEAHANYTRSLRAHRLNGKPLVAEPIWWDALLLTLFVIALYVLAAVWEANDRKPVRVDVSKVAVRGSK